MDVRPPQKNMAASWYSKRSPVKKRGVPSQIWPNSWLLFPLITNNLDDFEVLNMGMGQNPIPLVNIKIAGKWMFIPLKMVCIGIDPYPYRRFAECLPRFDDGKVSDNGLLHDVAWEKIAWKPGQPEIPDSG